jgi:transcriptional regulator with XRE-family HTH domain
MYEVFEKLLEKNGVTAYKVSKETGIGRSTFTDWKSGRSKPGLDKLIKIAAYFGVSVSYLTTGEGPYDGFSDENAHLVAKIRTDKDLSDALLKYFELSKEKRRHVVELINLFSE